MTNFNDCYNIAEYALFLDAHTNVTPEPHLPTDINWDYGFHVFGGVGYND